MTLDPSSAELHSVSDTEIPTSKARAVCATHPSCPSPQQPVPAFPSRIPVPVPPARSSCPQAHSSPCPHQGVSLIPEHADENVGAMLAQRLHFHHNWDLCCALGLDNPTGLGAGVEHSRVLLAFLEGTE